MDKAKRVADDLKRCADILHGLADLLTEDADVQPAKAEKPSEPKNAKIAQETQEAPAAKSAKAQKVPAAKPPITLEAVRAVAARIARAGAALQVKALIEQHGAKRLSAVPEEERAALMKELEGLQDGT